MQLYVGKVSCVLAETRDHLIADLEGERLPLLKASREDMNTLVAGACFALFLRARYGCACVSAAAMPLAAAVGRLAAWAK
jgi:hypothetical protein